MVHGTIPWRLAKLSLPPQLHFDRHTADRALFVANRLTGPVLYGCRPPGLIGPAHLVVLWGR